MSEEPIGFEVSKEQLVELILGLEVSIGTVERNLKDLKERQATAERRLIKIMEDHEEQQFKDEAGRTISRSDRLIVNVKKENEPQWFDYLEDIGRPDLIKTSVNKNSLNALIRKIVKGEENKPLPDFLDIERDLFFLPRVSIKLGQKSLRKAASDAGRDSGE